MVAGSQYQTLLSMAGAGDLDSAQRLSGSAQTYLSALRGTSATKLEYERAFGGVAAGVSGVGRGLAGMTYNEDEWRSKIIDLEQEANTYLLELDEGMVELEKTMSEQLILANDTLATILQELQDPGSTKGGAGPNQDWTNSGLWHGSDLIRPRDYVAPGGDLYDPPPGTYWQPTDLGYELRTINQVSDPRNVWVDPFGQLDLNPTAGPLAADGGVFTGPMSGYPATLHGTEAVIPLKSGSVPMRIDLSELISEIRKLRQETETLRSITVRQTMAAMTTAEIQDKWDRDGQPAERVL